MLPWSKPPSRSRSRREHNTAPMIRADLKAAGIPLDAYDLHSPRHCFVSQIVQCGGSVKDSMELARHHDADLTFGRDAHTRHEDLSKVVDRLADLWVFPTPPASAVSEGPHGTTPNRRGSSPERSQVDPSSYTSRFRSQRGSADGGVGTRRSHHGALKALCAVAATCTSNR